MSRLHHPIQPAGALLHARFSAAVATFSPGANEVIPKGAGPETVHRRFRVVLAGSFHVIPVDVCRPLMERKVRLVQLASNNRRGAEDLGPTAS